jgi:hypothetical protein
MSNWNPNSTKHKAQHCGYKAKPTKQNVNSLLNLYSACSMVKDKPTPANKKESNKQLKFNF